MYVYIHSTYIYALYIYSIYYIEGVQARFFGIDTIKKPRSPCGSRAPGKPGLQSLLVLARAYWA